MFVELQCIAINNGFSISNYSNGYRHFSFSIVLDVGSNTSNRRAVSAHNLNSERMQDAGDITRYKRSAGTGHGII
ncbi:hypothetical protein DCAR_0519440 [Daucus carota subsp. sativus]|uniref:Uncharacterized protein n=1 Tax=Daucus carota subsp. sativus TaxID=79200 RepID=A0A164XYV2_DAUCS|nr:hypothetical protein DCAR_0519440 [Daucus carota subsp. sativus]